MLLLARTGFIIRNLLLGTFADEVTRERPLVVAVPKPDDEKLLDIIDDRPITTIAFHEHVLNGPLTRMSKLGMWHTYMYRFKQAERDTSSLALQTRQWESGHTWIGEKVIQGLVGIGSALVNLQLMGIVEERYLRAINKWPVSQTWRTALERVQPAAVVSTMLTHAAMYTPSVDLPAVMAARALRIPVGTLVQSWDNLTSKVAVLPSWLDRYWTWSDFMSEQLHEMNPRVSDERVNVVGSPQFDFHLLPELLTSRENCMANLGMSPDRPYVLIGTGTEKWSPDEPVKTLRIARLLRKECPGVQVLVRLHPKDYPDRWKVVWDEFTNLGATIQVTAPETHMDKGGFVPPRDFYRDQINVIHHAAVVLNMASTLTVDAAILDRPVISIAYDVTPSRKYPEGRAWAFNNSTHFRALVETGGVRVVRSEAELLRAVHQYLADPRRDAAERRAIADRVAGPLDGKAGERLAHDALLLAEKRERAGSPDIVELEN